MANVIAQTQRPTIVMAHNKTLAAQLYGEFKAFFPNNAVEYFVSYYDYYQPEAYVPSSDTFIEKDSAGGGEMSASGKSAYRDFIRFNFPFRGAGADDFYRSQNIFLRSRKAIGCNPVMHDKGVKPQCVEPFGNSHSFM